MEDKLIIARKAKRTVDYIEKNVYNIPNEYKVLRDRIINSLYDLLENIYRANINQEKKYKEEVIVQIKILINGRVTAWFKNKKNDYMKIVSQTIKDYLKECLAYWEDWQKVNSKIDELEIINVYERNCNANVINLLVNEEYK